MAVDECRILGLEKYSPTALVWAEKLPPDKVLLFRGHLILPQSLNGRLQPDEWRPLIASAVLQKELLRRPATRVRSFLVMIGVALAVVFIGVGFAILIAQSLRIGPLSGPEESMAGLAILACPFLIGGLWRMSDIRRQRLQADSQIAHMSKEKLRQTLVRIQGFGFGTDPNMIRKFVSFSPSLSQRIRNLEEGPRKT